MKKIINLNKPIGPTSFQAIQLFRKNFPEFQNTRIGYAGRLDPLAHGVLLLLIGDETKNRADYLNLDKIYRFKILLGVKTDSYDVLGVIQGVNLKISEMDIKAQLKKLIPSLIGKKSQPYPPYSRIEVLGKPLFIWAKEGLINKIEIPKKEIEIYDLKLLKFSNINADQLKSQIVSQVSDVSGDFRQTEILKCWQDFFKSERNTHFLTADLEVSCSSGTYVRSIANEIGLKIGCGAITLDINRLQVGKYTAKSSLNLTI